MSEIPTQEDEEKSHFSLDDSDGYVTQRRLKDLFDARKTVREHRLEATRKLSKPRQNSVFRNALESYVMEIEPLLKRHDPSALLWSEYNFGTIVVESKDSLSGDAPKSAIQTKEKELPIIGLKSLFEYESPIVVGFEGDISNVTTEINKSILDEMFFKCNDFLAELGVEMDISEDKQPAKI